MELIRKLDTRLDALRDRLSSVKDEDIRASDIIVPKHEKKKLTNKEFHSEDFLQGYIKCDSANDINVGDFIRYKQKTAGQPAKYLWGGVVIYKCPEQKYIRVKNPYNKRVWSVQTANPDTIVVFYVREKIDRQQREVYESMDPDGAYVNLNTATSEGLIASIIDKGDEDVILAAANMIRESNRKTYLI
jgi:hypothetical protein